MNQIQRLTDLWEELAIRGLTPGRFFYLIQPTTLLDITLMSLTKNLEKCPYCREPIVSGAIRCRHCHADLVENSSKKSFWSQYNCFRTGFLCGVLFTIAIAVLAYFHFTGSN